MKNIIPLGLTLCILLTTVSVLSANQKVHLEKQMVLEKTFLNLPVENDAPRQRMQVIVAGNVVREFDIRLAVNKIDFWVFMYCEPFKNKKATLSIDVPKDAIGFEHIYQDDHIKNHDSLYQEKLRPQFHFSSRRGWNNDPNGLVFYDGEYHLFYQHNPYGWNWGNMHWGHAVSRDLLHWQELPDALYPDDLGTMFSGSAVVDFNNSSGFQTGENKVLVAAYTANGPDMQVQCIAYSNDKGRTWIKYAGNPVIGDRRDIVNSRHIRDPKVFWHQPTQKWIMALFEGTGISIFTSDNLKDWQYSSHTPGFWECPELFEIPVDGDINNKKWVMYGASGTYKIGEFDGSTFIMESGKHYYHRGALYAAQTYNNVPDGRRIQIGWGRIPAPEMPFNQMMTFPSELTLRTTNSGVRLFIEPIDEIKSLHKGEYIWDNILLTKEKPRVFEQVNDPLLHIVAEFEIQTGRGFGLVVHGYKISYDMNHNLLNDTFVSPVNNSLYLDILVDRNSIEIFANHGRFYIAQSHNSIDQPKQLECFTLQGETLLKRLEVYPLKSVW